MTTRSFWILSSLFGFMVIAGLITMNNNLIVVAFPLISYLTVAILRLPGEQKLRVERILSTDRISEGLDVSISIKVNNENTRIDELHLSEISSNDYQHLEGDVSKVVQLRSGEAINYEYSFQGWRGTYEFEGLRALSTDPFGLFEVEEHLPAQGKVLVYPKVVPLKEIPIRPPHTKGFSGPIPSRKSGTGMDFFGVRQYRLGDSLRRINWRKSERHSVNLYTNEYEQERIADVGILLDGRPHCDITFQGRRLFEYSVHAAASLANMFLNKGHCISLLVYSAVIKRVFPGYGKVQFERIMEALAHADTGVNYARKHLSYIPVRLMPPRGQLVYISPLAHSDLEPIIQFRNQGYSVLILSPDPLYYEQQNEPEPFKPDFQLAKRYANIERNLLINSLRQTGIQFVNWKFDQPLSDVVEKVRIQSSMLQRALKVIQ
jgi:uncharacterized protein (DUF58 family)